MRRLPGLLAHFLRCLVVCSLVVAAPAAAGQETDLRGNDSSPAMGAACGLIAPCTRVGDIGLHIAALGGFSTDRQRAFLGATAHARLALTFLDLAEIGTVLGGHFRSTPGGQITSFSSPASVYARLRILPIPLSFLRHSTFALLAQAQFDFIAPRLGDQAPGAGTRTTLSFVASQSYGPLDVHGSLGFVLDLAQTERPASRTTGYRLGTELSLWLKRATGDSASAFGFRGEALFQVAIDPRLPNHGLALLGLHGRTSSGYALAAGAGIELVAHTIGLRAMASAQFTFGKEVRNPLADRLTGQPPRIPHLWMDLFFIDPVLEADGCVWSDAFRDLQRLQIVCIGAPDPNDPKTILHRDGRRFPVGTHLWLGPNHTLLTDRQEVVATLDPFTYDRAVERQAQVQRLRDKESRGELPPGESACLAASTRIIPDGLDQGLAFVHLFGDEGIGARAAAVHELFHEARCNPNKPLTAGEALSILGSLKGKGPSHASPPRLQNPKPSRAFSDRTRAHIFHGEINKRGDSVGWHHEPSGNKSRGTHIVEGTRSPPDAHGVYEANVVIEGIKKRAKSSFFPEHWSIERVEKEIMEAYEHREPIPRRPGRFQGTSSSGVQIIMHIGNDAEIQTAFPQFGPR